jgi:hypothetical protein
MNDMAYSQNPTIKLIRIIGSPFVDAYEVPSSKEEAMLLYELAVKNKIGLLFLESLKHQDVLEKYDFTQEYDAEKQRNLQQRITAKRISEVLNAIHCHYAIIKSIVPFPGTPNDIDIIHFGTGKEYAEAIKHIQLSNFTEIHGEVDAEQQMFHDNREIPHPDVMKKDVFDVDFYQNLSASHLQYLNKKKLEPFVTETEVGGTPSKILKPSAEMVVLIIHSFIPEMIFTLFLYYAALFHIAKMEEDEIDEFIENSRVNNMTISSRCFFSLVGELHNRSFGFMPAKIKTILNLLGEDLGERTIFVQENNYKMPFKYSKLTVFEVLWKN